MAQAPGEEEEFVRESHLFWMLVKSERDHPVGRVYLAIQAALAYGAERVDVGRLMGEMMARGRGTTDAACEDVGGGGLAYFSWLYEVELAEIGEADHHTYRFRRRHDGKSVLATLRTGNEPKSLHFRQDYERERRKLEKKRAVFLAQYRRPLRF